MDDFDDIISDEEWDEYFAMMDKVEKNSYSTNSVAHQRFAKLYPNFNADFVFNLQDFITAYIQERYLPVRAMTADNMQILGNVAIVGCNPPHDYDNGQFDIIENEKTEYFVFPQHSPLYDTLVKKVKSMELWEPAENNYKTTMGWIHGKNRIVHINKNMLKNMPIDSENG